MDYEYTRYITTKDTIKDTLAQYGVAILPSVLDSVECEHMMDELWNYFEYISSDWETPISRNNKHSWKEIYTLYPKHSMLFQHYSVGHCQAVWNLRQNAKMLDIFATLWKTKPEDLLVSFDGLSFNMPPETTNRGWNRQHTWYHTDQSYTRNNLESIQSWVTALDVNDGDATLAFLEGSNAHHKAFADHFKVADKSDWYKLTEEEEEWYVKRGCVPKKIKCPKGSVVFWDSRTIHCGVEASKEREKTNFRAVIYLCYTPRSACTDKNRQKKIRAFEELRTTNHYPNKPKLFSKIPRSYGGELRDVKMIEAPVLTAIGRRLVGYEK